MGDDFGAAIAQRVSPLCAAGQARTRLPITARRGRCVSQASQVSDEEQKWRLAAGGNTPLAAMVERGALELLKPSRLAESGRFADEPDQGVLVGHKVTLQNGHMARSQAVHGHSLEPQPFQNAVTALGTVAAAIAFFPGRAAVGDLAG